MAWSLPSILYVSKVEYALMKPLLTLICKIKIICYHYLPVQKVTLFVTKRTFMKQMIKKNGIALIMISSLVLLPGCGLLDWLKEKLGSKPGMGQQGEQSGEVLVTIDGKPLITKGMLEFEKKRLLEANPQLQAMIALMDEKQLDRNLMEGLISREVIRKYVKDNHVEESEKYKNEFDMVLGQVKDALNTRYFMESLEVNVDDAEIQAFYDQNKAMMPNLMVSQGGINAAAVAFNDAQSAKDFLGKVKAGKNNIFKVAQESGLSSKVKDFKLVNDQTVGVDGELKSKILAISTFPKAETFKVGKEHWVVVASKKEDAQYRPLDQVKAEIEQSLKKDKTMKRFEEEVARCKGEFKIQVNEDYFSARQEDNAASVQAAAEQEAVQAVEVAQAAQEMEAKEAPEAAPQAA